MANAQVLYAESASDVTANSTTYVDVCSISDGSFTANKKYLIIAIAYIRCSSTTNNARCRLVHGTTPTVFTDAAGEYELASGGSIQRTCVGFMHTFTQGGTTELVKLQIANSSTSTTTCDLAQIIAIKLDDDFTENTDYYFNEVTADYTTTTSFVAQAAITFTPDGVDDWLVIGQASVTPGDVTVPFRMSLHDSVEGLDEPQLVEEGEEAGVENRQLMIMRVYTPSNASHTFSVRFNHTTTASTANSSRIFAINLSKFAQWAKTYTAAEATPAATPTFTNVATLSITPSATGDFVILGYFTSDINGVAGSDEIAMRLQVNNGGGLASDPAYGDDAPGNDAWDTTDQLPVAIGKVRSLTSGAARTINLDVTALTGTAARIQERSLVAFSVALATSDQTISPSAIASAEAFGSPQLNLALALTGIASLEAFGSHQLSLALALTGIASLEGFGAQQIDLTLLANAIASLEAFGAHEIQPGPVTVSPSGIMSAEGLGSAQLNLALLASAIASLEAFGAHEIQPGPVAVSPSGIGSAEAFGAHQFHLTLLANAIASTEAFGATVLTLYVTPNGIATEESFGALRVDLVLLPSGLVSAEGFGSHQLNLSVIANAIASGEAFGSHAVNLAGEQSISPSGLTSGESFGSHQLNLALALTGIASMEAFGAYEIDLTLLANAIASLESFGVHEIQPGPVTVSPSGIGSGEGFESHQLNLTLLANAIASAEAFGVTVLTLYVTPNGITTEESFGAVRVDMALIPNGLGSVEAFGSHQLNLRLEPEGVASGESVGAPVLTLYLVTSGVIGGEAFGAPTLQPGVVVVSPSGIGSAEAFGVLVLSGGTIVIRGPTKAVLVGSRTGFSIGNSRTIVVIKKSTTEAEV